MANKDHHPDVTYIKPASKGVRRPTGWAPVSSDKTPRGGNNGVDANTGPRAVSPKGSGSHGRPQPKAKSAGGKAGTFISNPGGKK